MHIDKLLALNTPHTQDNKRFIFADCQVSDDWSQGRTLYGGLSAAMAFSAMRTCVDSNREIHSLSTNFIGPLMVDEAFHIEVDILRSGKNMTQIVAKIIQRESICLMSQGCFGIARKSSIKVAAIAPHAMSAPEKAKYIPQIPKITPKFLRHFELAIEDGKIPFTWSKKSHYHGWMRFKQGPEQLTNSHLVALADTWPPAVLQMLKLPAAASTVSWSLDFLQPYTLGAGDEWLAYQVKTQQAANGYGHTEATIWNAQGQPIALSRQTVAVFG
jgi:acyl-CoA thioesterase II